MNDSPKEIVVGVDLGGTNIRAGLVVNSAIVKTGKNCVPMGIDNGHEVTDTLIQTIEQVITPETKGIGLGVPGLVDRERGILYFIQNIPAWKTVHLKSILEKQFNVPVFLNNDSNCFAVGERLFGHGRSSDNFLGITMGTGLGAGIINNGKLLNDANCGSGEFGNIPYLDSVYEDYCSGKFFRTFYKSSGEELAQKAFQNDSIAIKAYHEFGKHVGNAIKTVMFAVDPEMVILGGAIAKSGILYEKAMREEINKFPFPNSLQNFRVLFSTIDDSAILGAAALYHNAQN
ncbi:MAG: ROK family protein [Salinivirgaceae bacterium]